MRLGTLSLENNYMLAPMLNVTTAPYRRFLRHFFPIGLVYVPMFYTKRLAVNSKSVEHELLKIEEEGPIAVQLIGNDKDALKKAIQFLESYDYNLLDINAGCPSKRAINSEEGGALLKDLPLLEKLLLEAIKYCSKPVSLKTRLNFEETGKINKILARIINESGIEFVTIHSRYVKDRFDNNALDLNHLKELRKLIDVPLIGNGDIKDGKTAKTYLEGIGTDGIMIGRESVGNPDIFNQINYFLNTGKEITENKTIEFMKTYFTIYSDILDKYLEDIELPFSKKDYQFTELKRNGIWLSRNIQNSTIIRQNLSKIKNLKDLVDYIESL